MMKIKLCLSAKSVLTVLYDSKGNVVIATSHARALSSIVVLV